LTSPEAIMNYSHDAIRTRVSILYGNCSSVVSRFFGLRAQVPEGRIETRQIVNPSDVVAPTMQE
jgi:hypothetical protein